MNPSISLRSPLVLDLGCGRRKHPGAIGMDNVFLETVDVVHDLLAMPYPFASGCADEMIFSHVLEHFLIQEINLILDETYRILTSRGVVTISVPHAMSVAFPSDPTHKTAFTFQSWYYFTSDHRLSYYKQLTPVWKIVRLWASVNLFNNNLVPTQPWQQSLESYATRVMRYLVRHSRSQTLPDLVVKQFPFWLVNIHCQLMKSAEVDKPGNEHRPLP